MVILDLVEKGGHEDSLISESIQGIKNELELFPVFFGENAHLCYLYGLVIIEAGQIGPLDKEDIQKLYLC